MEHKDSVGNRGRLIAGSAQWMTAGRGIIHSEMPKQEQGLMWGFQLWVNLPAARKMIPPRYQDIPPDRIPEVDVAGGRVRVVAGRLAGQEGPVAGIDVEPIFLDVALPEGGAFRAEIPEGHNAFVFVTRGGFAVGSEGRAVGQGFMSLLNQGPFVDLRSTHKDARALVIAGRPLREPVARYGPFVMNTQAEIQKAIDDYRSGRLVQS
jgi:redox-sensitive bicupin YhaK (pirin superfamily)